MVQIPKASTGANVPNLKHPNTGADTSTFKSQLKGKISLLVVLFVSH